MDMVMNARSPADLDHVYALTLTLLQYRADPNVHIATTEPMICHSQSSVFLKKSSHQVLYYYVQVCQNIAHFRAGPDYKQSAAPRGVIV